jgi:glycyl-tRNA synthetase beta chain
LWRRRLGGCRAGVSPAPGGQEVLETVGKMPALQEISTVRQMPDFLLEIGCEEIPARMIDDARALLGFRLIEVLKDEQRLWDDYEEVPQAPRLESFSTPRRLAVLIRGVRALQADVEEQVLGPSLKVAFKDGQPTPAAVAFSKRVAVSVADLQTVTTSKGQYLAANVVQKGRKAIEILSELLPNEIGGLYWPKSMYWRQPSERFVRPVRWLVALLGGDVIPIEFAGENAGSESWGHRVLAPGRVPIVSPQAYEQALREAKVMADQGKRRPRILEQLIQAAGQELRYREDDNLVDKVTNLTECPTVILGSFDRAFLQLPEEVLVTVMRDHQNYFAVEDAGSHKLTPHFLAVLNTDGDPNGIIRHGHERVLRARFNDARFFWQTDQKHSLRERVAWLKNVTFQKDLGSYYEKTRRVQELCRRLSAILKNSGATGMDKIRSGIIHKAAWLSKTDLTTELVKEFTELQGIVGGLYARAQVLDPDMKADAREAVAVAIYDHYKPQSMEDSVPRSVEGAVVSIADKADSIAGMFALGLQPTGSKDPFALRRQANGIVKTIAEHKLRVKLSSLLKDAREAYVGSAAEGKFAATVDYTRAVATFLRERLEFYLREALGFKYDVVNAVLAADSDDVVDAVARAEAVNGVLHMPEFQAIAAACKRIRNILKQAKEVGTEPATKFQYLPDSAHEEKSLAAYVETYAPRVEAHRQKKEYQEALFLLSTAREPVDTFFDKVMVMVDDEHVRTNRLALLQTLLKEFSTIADFAEIVTEGKESKESSKQ